MKIKFKKKRLEDIKPDDKRQVFYDESYPGLALLVTKAGAKTFYFTYRIGKGRGSDKKWVMLGKFPNMTVEQALDEAKVKAAMVTKGEDPAKEMQDEKEAVRMDSALSVFMEEHVSKLKPGTRKQYTAIHDNHLVPKPGKLRVKNVVHAEIAKIHREMKETPYLANRCLAVLSKFFSWCELNGHRERNSNPVTGITKYREEKRQDFMGATELAILGETLARMENTWNERKATKTRRPSEIENTDTITPQAAAAIRLLMLTGARLMEVLSLTWNRIDLDKGTARIPDEKSKTGFKVLQLSAPAIAVLESLPLMSEFVFPATSATGHMVNLKDAWGDVLKQSGLAGWRIHDLRHAFASMMINEAGASLPIVGKILGHTQVST